MKTDKLEGKQPTNRQQIALLEAERDELKAQLDAAQKACAEMRQLLSNPPSCPFPSIKKRWNTDVCGPQEHPNEITTTIPLIDWWVRDNLPSPCGVCPACEFRKRTEHALSTDCGKDYRKDDPESDGTDGAHPAWWRGNDAGSLATAEKLERAADGKDDGSGVIAHPEIERARRKILAQRSAIQPLVEALGMKGPWTVIDILHTLANWCDHLGVVHDCDCNGHEVRTEAVKEARRMIEKIQAALHHAQSLL